MQVAQNTMSTTKRFYLAGDGERTEILHSDTYPKMRYEGGEWTSMSPGTEDLAESKAQWGMPEEPCKCCGNVFSTNYSEPTKSQLLEKNVCFKCNFWQEYLEIKDDPNIARIEGSHYVIQPDTTGDPSWKGFGGRKFIIRFADGREVVTRNLWHQGEIPAHFREELPDNATFVQE